MVISYLMYFNQFFLDDALYVGKKLIKVVYEYINKNTVIFKISDYYYLFY